MAHGESARSASVSTSVSTHQVVVLGTGFSGVGMAINLKKAGIDDFVVLEKADDVGGTWRENTYPGAACDVPSHLYCFSFEPKPDWSRVFAPQSEILGYIRHCAEKYGIRPHVRFRTEVLGARFDDAKKMWEVATRGGHVYRARFLVSGKGALHVPSKPKIEGADKFEGALFHSAEWDHSIDVTGKRVAVIGSGASAIQIVPAIAGKVKELHYYQRTAPWVLPRMDRPYTASEKETFRKTPARNWLHRQRIYWTMEPRVLGFVVDPRIMTVAQALGRQYIARHIKDPALREKVTPKFTMGCKRTLISDDYYQALSRRNVEVITDGIRAITETGIVTKDGKARDVDVIVFCTGFTVTDYLSGMDIEGTGGRKLRDDWAKGAPSYFGINVAGYPNYFMLMGPSTGLGHNSMIFMIESQIHFTLQAIKAAEKRGVRAVDVKPAAQAKFVDEMQRRIAKSVWATGCTSWYMQEDGQNYTTWPGFTFEYRARTLRFDANDYVLS